MTVNKFLALGKIFLSQRRLFQLSVFLVAANSCFLPACQADFALNETRQVPINRLLNNVSRQRLDLGLSPTDKAMIEFRLGRLHAMAYALKSEEGPTDKAVIPGSRFELPDFGNVQDHIQFKIVPTTSKSKADAALIHLHEAIKYLRRSVQIDSSLLAPKLGLAWCLEQSGDKFAALSMYRAVFKESYNWEINSRGGMYDWSIAIETAGYLKALLNKNTDKKELADISNKVRSLEKIPRAITPILLPLEENLDINELVENKSCRFDLDGRGARIYDRWISKKAGWLVFDPEKKGSITSGLQLIGSVTFWLFWKNGYEVLQSLDDNQDGKLAASELDHLAIWQDANGNAKSEPGEVKPLSDWGIVALNTGWQKDQTNLTELTGLLISPEGLTLTSGKKRATYDLILRAKPQ